MKLLVTGGAGFIGSHIVDKLVSRGDEVIIVDNLSTGKRKNLNLKAKFYDISITDPKIEEIFLKEKPEYVIHHAAQVDVGKAIRDPIYDATINILGSINILENCRKHGVKKIVYGNSGGAGPGEPQYLPVDEKHPKNPQSPYGASKQTVEFYLKIYAHLYGLKFTSLGYANVYGPRQDPFGEGGVIAIFSYKMFKNEPITVFGDGEQTRDYIYVGDIADANILALSKGDNECFTVGTGTETSLNNLVKIMKELSQSNTQTKYTSPRAGDILRSSLNPAKIKKLIGWEPKVSLNEGLKNTMEALKNG